MADPTVNEKREPFCRAIETSSLMKELEKLRDGEEITYEELSKIAMGNCAPTGIKKGFLKSARDILFKNKGVEFKAIPNVGLQRMTDEDKMEKIIARQGIHRFTEMRDISNVVDFFISENSDFITGQILNLGGV